ncbi:MAG: putative hydrolase or acyltransferase of alpha/beta [Planctomycetota bacterium]|nr:MAG: putative hydrolase or acyltransferase of alpha/beta [Planctomycetota bacterium]
MTFLDLGSGPPILFLHGVGMRAVAYRRMLTLVGERFRVLAPDLPGAGGTPMPSGEATLEGFAQEVGALLDARGVKPVAVVGHSLGGAVGLALAAARGWPERMVLLDSAGCGTPFSMVSLVLRFFLLKNLRVALWPPAWTALWRVLPHFMSTVGFRPRKAVRLGKLALAAAKVCYRIPAEVGSRVVFVAASHDELFPVKFVRERAEALPGSRLIVVRGGHDWCLLQPREGARVVLEALQ